VVERFLELLGAGDVDGAVELLSADVEYMNVGLPTVRSTQVATQFSAGSQRQAIAEPEANARTTALRWMPWPMLRIWTKNHTPTSVSARRATLSTAMRSKMGG